jgi:hypothetical protein
MDLDEIIASKRNREDHLIDEIIEINKELNRKIKVWPTDDPRLAGLVQKACDLGEEVTRVKYEIEQIEAKKHR